MNQEKRISKTHFEELMGKDRWHADELGLKFSPNLSTWWLPFSKISLPWLRRASKKFIYQQASTKTFNTCRSYLSAFTSFGVFLVDFNPNIKPSDITRQVIVEYLHELCAVQKLKPPTVQLRLSTIKYFFELNVREKWLDLPKEPLIFYDDFPRRFTLLPKFIPENVVNQLLEHLPELSKPNQHLITLFLETGRRRGEIFSLAYHCLQQDNDGDYLLKIEDQKMKQSLLIPVSENCVEHIKQQQADIAALTPARDFLFVRKRKGEFQLMTSRTVIDRVNALAKKKNIVDANGCLWHFHFHQFRHTTATTMINHGVPHHVIQRYLGHLSPRMTARYATIHDATLKNEFKKFQKTLSQSQEEMLIEKVLSDPSALSDYKKELEDIKKCVEMAESKGWKEALTHNLLRQEELEKMIAIIERGDIDAKSEA